MKLKKTYYTMGAAMTSGMLAFSGSAHANNFSTISQNITTSIGSLPGLLAALAYLFGVLLGVLGIMKIKDHVENPGNTPLKDGAVRLLAGGALFALPIIYESMLSTLGSGSTVGSAVLKKTSFTVS